MTDSENLRPFPGASGTSSGRECYRGISEALRRFVEEPAGSLRRRKPKTEAEAIALALLRRALAGDVEATRVILDRLEGKVPSVFTGAAGAALIPPGLFR